MKKYLYLILFFLVCVPAIAGTINSYTLKSPPDSADTVVIYDSDDGSTKKVTIGDVSSSGAGFTDAGVSVYATTTTDNVAIGTTTPTQKLTVAGTVAATAFTGDGSALTGISGSGINWSSYPDLTALTNAQEFLVNNGGTSSSINWEVFQTQISAGGWTDAGTFISTTTSTDLVGVGTTSVIEGNAAKINVYSTAAPTDSTTYSAFDLGYGFLNKYVYSNDTNDVIWGLTGSVVNTGSAGGSGHSIGVAGRASDTASGNQALVGVEGRTDVYGQADHVGGVLGFVSTLNNTSYTGDSYGVYTGFSGNNLGQVIAFKAPDVSTGIRQYSFWGEDNIVLHPTGNVGIGTFLPINSLQVGKINSTVYSAAGSNTVTVSAYNNDTTDNTWSEFKAGQTNTNGALASTGRMGFIHTNHTAGSETDEFVLVLKNAGTFEEKLRIKANGNFGIGTVSPRQALEVVGTIRGTAFMSSDGSAGVTGSSCTAWKNGLCTSL